MTTPTFKRWYDERPPNERGVYRWRLPDVTILDAVLTVEWTEDLHLCGMGLAASQWWPTFSDWDGWNRSLPKAIEWRPLTETETAALKGRAIYPLDVVYHGLDLLPCPFAGVRPRVEPVTRYVGAGPWRLDRVVIAGYGSSFTGPPAATARLWNQRHTAPIEALAHAAHNMAGVIAAANQWLRNIEDGISIPADARANLEKISNDVLEKWGDAMEQIRNAWRVQ